MVTFFVKTVFTVISREFVTFQTSALFKRLISMTAQILTASFSSGLLSAIQRSKGDKGVLLLACSAALAIGASRECYFVELERSDHAVRLSAYDLSTHTNSCCRNTFNFVLGFSATHLLASLVGVGCVKFVRRCFLLQTPHDSNYGTRADRSRTLAFMGDVTANAHTAVVLLQVLRSRPGDTGQRQSNQFRLGNPSVMPWGLPMMRCPFCEQSINVAISTKHGIPRLSCVACSSQTSACHKPSFVDAVTSDGVPPHHFKFPFPLTSYKDSVLWIIRKDGKERLQRWTSLTP